MDPDPDYDRLHALIGSVEAPPALRERLDADRARMLTRAMVVRRMKLTGAMAGVAAVAGVALALIAPSGNGPAPDPLRVVALAGRGPLAGPPPPDRAHPRLLRSAVGGVPFPRWSGRFGWRPSGRRDDTVAGRATTTVFYDAPAGLRLAYTIVDGPALAWAPGARTVVRSGLEVHVLRRSGRIVAQWRARGRSCLISAPAAVGQARIVALAAESYPA